MGLGLGDGTQACHGQGVGCFGHSEPPGASCVGQRPSQAALPLGLCRTPWYDHRQAGGPQVEQERHVGSLTLCVCVTCVTAVSFPHPSPPSPACPRKLSPSIRPLWARLLSFGCMERTWPTFPEAAQCGALLRAFSYLSSLFSEWFRTGFNLGINLTKVQHLLLCMENALQSVVYLSSSIPLLFALIFGA